MWVTWKELKVPSYPLVQKVGPIHQNFIWGPSLRLTQEPLENRLFTCHMFISDSWYCFWIFFQRLKFTLWTLTSTFWKYNFIVKTNVSKIAKNHFNIPPFNQLPRSCSKIDWKSLKNTYLNMRLDSNIKYISLNNTFI